MKKTLAIIPAIVLTGCIGMHVHNRSVVSYTDQKAETYGAITNTPRDSGTHSVAAEKTTDLATSVSTSSGNAEAQQEEAQKNAD